MAAGSSSALIRVRVLGSRGPWHLQVYVGAGRRDYVEVEERVAVADMKQTPSRVEHGG